NTFSSLAGAFAAAAELSGHVRITIQDNGTYDMPKTLALTANLVRVDLRAWDGPRPLVRGDVTIDVATPGAHVVLDGIVLDGTVTIDASAPHFRLELQDATLVPLRQPSVLSAAMLLDAHVLLRRSICGRVVLPELGTRLDASESILDGAGANAIEGPRATAGPETTLRECTVLGGVHAYAADVRGSIVEGALTVEAGDASSAGHSMIRRVDGFDVPRSVRAVRTRFVSRRYGTDGYGGLPLDADPFLLGGASNGEELGAFHAAATGRRLANVRTVLDEYVPYGIVAGVIDEG
ncbi:MAG TPA: hypothetical protein VHT53_02665, partial [Candidatus Elarobacter sp.]|nr:hypothetical protein [Candidatus Elarobacter sp.]